MLARSGFVLLVLCLFVARVEADETLHLESRDRSLYSSVDSFPRLESDGYHSHHQNHLMIAVGAGERASDYRKLRAYYRDQGYVVHLYFPASESSHFDGNYQAVSENIRLFVQNIQTEMRPQELHVIGHSMAYGAIMHGLFEDVGFRSALNSVSLINPMMGLENFAIEDGSLVNRQANEMLPLVFRYYQRGELREYRYERSVAFSRGYNQITQDVSSLLADYLTLRRLDQGNALPPIQFFLSREDPNTDHRRTRELWAGTGLVDLVEVESHDHNLHRRMPDQFKNALPGTRRGGLQGLLQACRSFSTGTAGY